MNFKKLIYACILGGIFFLSFGCNPRNNRAYLEKRIGTEMSRVYPTERLENLFDQFPGGFKITQSFMDGDDLFTVEIIARSKGEPISGTVSKVGDNGIDKIFETNFHFKDEAYIIHVELVATNKGGPIIGTISKIENKSREKIFETNFQYQDGKYQFANESDEAYWPYQGFLFEKLTLNRDVLSKLDLQEKSYSMMNGDFELRYKVTNEIINSFLGLGDSDSLSVSLVGSNSNRGYYYSIVIKNEDGLLFIETVSD